MTTQMFLVVLNAISTAESESSVGRSVEVKQTMQQRLLQCGSRLCRHCVLELHNALAWARK